MRILIVEDESELSNSMYTYLKSENYVCDVVSSLEIAIDKVTLFEYDCIILDLMLPDGEGYSLLEYLGNNGKNEGVIIISAKTEVEEKIIGLKKGADDYLIKPFYLAELSARIYSIIRRKHFDNTNIQVIENIQINLLEKAVYSNNENLFLTRKEFELLLYFISNRGRVLSKSMLAEHLSGDIADMLSNFDFIYAHVKNLKKKLSQTKCSNFIKTAYGVGYKWEEN